jgi:NAD(P)H dehydrogenase (quinone)
MLVTGASGQLGRLVIDRLLQIVPAERVAAIVRSPEAAARLSARGVDARRADYAQPETLQAALGGIDRVLLISSNDLGDRVSQHGHVIAAAQRAGVSLLAYTSVLHAETSPLGLAAAHRETEAMLRDAGLPFVLLRNGWYTENYMAAVPAALAHGALIGSAGEGRVSSAARVDYAEAAAAVLTSAEDLSGRTFELAGDASYSLSELAAELARQSGKPMVYRDLAEEAYRAALVGAGLPEAVASLLADSDVGASKGALFDDGRQLSALIGRPTTPLADSIREALSAA